MEKKIHDIIVAGFNANGEPDFHTVKVRCTKGEYEDGEHYAIAMEHADLHGFDSAIAYDDTTYNAEAFFGIFDWDEVETIDSGDYQYLFEE